VKTVDLEAKTTTPAVAAAAGDKNSVTIDEDDPDKYRHAVYVMTCKLFADIERLKVKDAEKQAEEKYACLVSLFEVTRLFHANFHRFLFLFYFIFTWCVAA
jgi:hypothetical protein